MEMRFLWPKVRHADMQRIFCMTCAEWETNVHGGIYLAEADLCFA